MVSTLLLLIVLACSPEGETPDPEVPAKDTTFHFGADLSYVNQILDHDGLYKANNTTQDPYAIFHVKGTDLVRLRLWHNPAWTKDVYGALGTQLYNDLPDVERAIRR
jgi:arabinogalactan endo-1,4-beta-galactosidase